MAGGDERWSRGTAAYASQFRLRESEVFGHLSGLVGERLATEAINAAGGVWGDDVLSLRDRSLAVVTALAVQGGVEERLRAHVHWALDHGVTPDELEALITLLAVYAGYPKASVAMEVVREVLGEPEAEAPTAAR
jgi:4-carboxymuconolactone decarboxylase